jgi:PTS system mannose-specific IIA component
MIKIVIATHNGLGRAYYETLELIMGKQENIEVVEVDLHTQLDELKKVIKNDIDEAAGTLILTDMFGGTPSNISIPFLVKDRVEIVFGLNLPMLLTAVSKRDKLRLSELAEVSAKSGRDSIFRALDI